MNWKDRPQPYWEHKDWYQKRNEQIRRDRASGMTWRELTKKFDVSRTYMVKVIEREDGNDKSNTK